MKHLARFALSSLIVFPLLAVTSRDGRDSKDTRDNKTPTSSAVFAPCRP